MPAIDMINQAGKGTIPPRHDLPEETIAGAKSTQRELTSSEAATAQQVTDLSLRLFPDLANDSSLRQRILSLANEAYKLTDDVYTMDDAEMWGNRFTIPPASINKDTEDYLRHGSNIVALATERLQAVGSQRLSNQRPPLSAVLSPDNAEVDKLQRLADEGMPLMPDPLFQPNSSLGIRPPLRAKYVATHSAVDKLLFDNFHQKGLAVVLPLKVVQEGADANRYHLSPLSWTPKTGAAKGRPITDGSDGGPGAQPLNSTHTKDRCDEAWGSIRHPTIQDIAVMVDNYVRDPISTHPGDKIVIWKMDLKGAYTLLSFRPEDVPLLGVEMTDDLVMFFLCGIFGWTGTPACFQVVTRAIKHELARKLKGAALMYVDDIFGVCKQRDLDHDMHIARSICEAILGNDSVEPTKTESGLRLGVIGYDIDIARGLITVSRKNVLKAFHGFLSTDVDSPITTKTLQKLASWASRYSEICRYMKPFNKALYAAYAGKTNTQRSYPIPPSAKVSIWMFRVLLALTAVKEIEFSRPLSSFRKDVHAAWIVEFDASLSGIGILWFYQENSESPEVLLGGCSLDITSLDFGTDASNQNTAEYIAAALGIRGLRAFAGFDTSSKVIGLRGDSVTALTWSVKRRARSSIATNASVYFALQCMARGVEIAKVTHLTAEQNWKADMLSRGASMADVGLKDDTHPYRHVPIVDLKAERVLELCDPKWDFAVNEDSFVDFWTRVQLTLAEEPALVYTDN